jgi:hypothetical protein
MGSVFAAAGIIGITPEDWGADGCCPGVGELDGMADNALTWLFRGTLVGDSITCAIDYPACYRILVCSEGKTIECKDFQINQEQNGFN